MIQDPAAAKASTLKANALPDDLPSEIMRSAWHFWDEARKAAALPPVAAIDPTRLPKPLMPFITTVTVEENPQRFQLRLIGNAGITAAGRNYTGRYVDELPDGKAMVERLALCVSTKRPYYYEGPIGFVEKGFRRYRTLGLPFGDSTAGKVTRLMGVTEFD